MADDERVPQANSGEETAAWAPERLGAVYDQMIANSGAPLAPPAVSETDLIPAPTPAAAAPHPPADTQAAEVSADDAALHKAAHEFIQELGGVEEIKLLKAVADPLLEGELNIDAILGAIQQARGEQFVGQLARKTMEVYWGSFVRDVLKREGETIIRALVLTDAEVARLDEPSRIWAESVRAANPELTQDVAEFRKGNGLGIGRPPSAAPALPNVLAMTNGNGKSALPQPTAKATGLLPQIDADDYDQEVQEFVEAAQAQSSYVTALEARIAKLEGQVTEVKSTTVDTRKEQDRAAEERVGHLYREVDGVVANLTRNLTFSVKPDPAEAEEENKLIRSKISKLCGADWLAAINADRQADGTASPNTPAETFDRAAAAVRRGDFLGRQVKDDIQKLKALMNDIAATTLPLFNGRAVAAKAEAAVTTPSTRTVVSGPGAGSAPQLPEPIANTGGKAWENMGQQYETLLSRRTGQRPS